MTQNLSLKGVVNLPVSFPLPWAFAALVSHLPNDFYELFMAIAHSGDKKVERLITQGFELIVSKKIESRGDRD